MSSSGIVTFEKSLTELRRLRYDLVKRNYFPLNSLPVLVELCSSALQLDSATFTPILRQEILRALLTIMLVANWPANHVSHLEDLADNLCRNDDEWHRFCLCLQHNNSNFVCL